MTLVLTGCGNDSSAGIVEEIPDANMPSEGPYLAYEDAGFEGARISITAGDTILYADLNDSRTSYEFTQLLPLQLDTIERMGLAKGLNLPESIYGSAERTREYELGGIAYWPEGPDIAIFYTDDLYEQTIVEVITMGKIESGVEVFAGYDGPVAIELADKTQ